MNVSLLPASIRSIGLSSRSAAATVTDSPSAAWPASGSPSCRAATGSSVRVVFVGESDMGVLLIRCLESELYASIVALSIILDGGVRGGSFDASYALTCLADHKYRAHLTAT